MINIIEHCNPCNPRAKHLTMLTDKILTANCQFFGITPFIRCIELTSNSLRVIGLQGLHKNINTQTPWGKQQ